MLSLFYILHNPLQDTFCLLSLLQFSLAVALQRLPTADIPFPLGSRIVPGLSYQQQLTTTEPQRLSERLAATNQSQIYVMTNGQSSSLPWCQAIIWGPRPDFCYCQRVACLLMCGALSVKRTGLSFTTAAGPRQHSHSRVLVPRDSWPYFTVSDSRLHRPGGPCPRIYIPPNRVTRLYPQALGSLFVASYDSQGYGGGIRTCIHAGLTATANLSCL
jgi:hypothetical protein